MIIERRKSNRTSSISRSSISGRKTVCGQISRILLCFISNFFSVRVLLILVSVVFLLVNTFSILTISFSFFFYDIEKIHSSKAHIVSKDVKDFTQKYFFEMLNVAHSARDYINVFLQKGTEDGKSFGNYLEPEDAGMENVYQLAKYYPHDYLEIHYFLYNNSMVHIMKQDKQYYRAYYVDYDVRQVYFIPDENGNNLTYFKVGFYPLYRNDTTKEIVTVWEEEILTTSELYTWQNKAWYKKSLEIENVEEFHLIENVNYLQKLEFSSAIRINDPITGEFLGGGYSSTSFDGLANFLKELKLGNSVIVLVNSDTNHIISSNVDLDFRGPSITNGTVDPFGKIQEAQEASYKPLAMAYSEILKSTNVNDDFKRKIVGDYIVSAQEFSIVNLNITFVSVTPILSVYTSLILSVVFAVVISFLLFICVSGTTLLFGVFITSPLMKIIRNMRMIKDMEFDDMKIGKSFLKEVREIQKNLRITVDKLKKFRSFLPKSLLVVNDSDCGSSSKKMSIGRNSESSIESIYSSGGSDASSSLVTLKNVFNQRFKVGLSQKESHLMILNFNNFSRLLELGHCDVCIQTMDSIVEYLVKSCKMGRIMEFRYEKILVSFGTIGRAVENALKFPKFMKTILCKVDDRERLEWKVIIDSGEYYQGVIGNDELKSTVVVEKFDYFQILPKVKPFSVIIDYSTIKDLMKYAVMKKMYFVPCEIFVNNGKLFPTQSRPESRLIPIFYLNEFVSVHKDNEWIYLLHRTKTKENLNSLMYIVFKIMDGEYVKAKKMLKTFVDHGLDQKMEKGAEKGDEFIAEIEEFIPLKVRIRFKKILLLLIEKLENEQLNLSKIKWGDGLFNIISETMIDVKETVSVKDCSSQSMSFKLDV